MKKMQAQMNKLRATTYPVERQKLMQEPMVTMQEAMKDIGGTGRADDDGHGCCK